MCKHRVNFILCALLCTVTISALCASCGSKEAPADGSASMTSTSSATASLSGNKQSSSEQSAPSSADTSSFSVDEALNDLAEIYNDPKARSEFEAQLEKDLAVPHTDPDPQPDWNWEDIVPSDEEIPGTEWNFEDTQPLPEIVVPPLPSDIPSQAELPPTDDPLAPPSN